MSDGLAAQQSSNPGYDWDFFLAHAGFNEVTKFVRPLLYTLIVLLILMVVLMVIAVLIPSDVRGLLVTMSGSLAALLLLSILLDSQTLQQQKQSIEQQKQTIEENRKQIESLQALTLGLQRATLELTEANPGQGEQTKEAIEKSVAQTDNVRQLPPRIYVQISREDQRKLAAQVARELQTRGYIVPGIQIVRGKPTSTSQLRHCQTDDIVEDDIAGIIKTLQSIHVFVTPQRLPTCGNVRPRHYEIWFSKHY